MFVCVPLVHVQGSVCACVCAVYVSVRYIGVCAMSHAPLVLKCGGHFSKVGKEGIGGVDCTMCSADWGLSRRPC